MSTSEAFWRCWRVQTCKGNCLLIWCSCVECPARQLRACSCGYIEMSLPDKSWLVLAADADPWMERISSRVDAGRGVSPGDVLCFPSWSSGDTTRMDLIQQRGTEGRAVQVMTIGSGRASGRRSFSRLTWCGLLFAPWARSRVLIKVLLLLLLLRLLYFHLCRRYRQMMNVSRICSTGRPTVANETASTLAGACIVPDSVDAAQQ